MLIPLRVRSHHSVGKGTASVEALVSRAAALGLTALALTDIENLSGQPRFHDLCQRSGIRAITGLELRGRSPGSMLLLLARDDAGYRSLTRIVSRRRQGAGTEAEQLAAQDPIEAVAAYPEGLVVMTGDAQTLARLLDRGAVDAAHVRALLTRPARGDPQALLRVAAERRVPLAANAQALLAERADQPLHALLQAIDRDDTLDEAALAVLAEQGPWLRSSDDSRRLFADAPAAVAEAIAIADGCRFELRRRLPVLPGAEAFGGRSPDVELTYRCETALRAARAAVRCRGEAYGRRLAQELGVVVRLGYAGYFLLAAEVADGARALGIPIASRGSAAASLIVHLLGVSPLDPIEAGLYFERFLHAQRMSPPDIDLDVCSQRRDELIRYVYERFGRQRVTMVGAHHGYRLLSALSHGLAAVGVPSASIRKLGAALGRRGLADELDPAALPGDLPQPCRPQTMQTILRLIGKPRSLAVHPGGIVVAPGDIDALVPIERAPRSLTVAQYDADAIESTGLTKLDLLGNRFLSQLGETLQRVAARPNGDSNTADPVPDAGDPLPRIPLEDDATLRRLDRADTIGCFQVETPAVRSLLTQLPIESHEDVIAALALVRPGAASGAVKREYVRRAHGEGTRHVIHAAAAQQLTATHGLLLYDEDLMRVLSVVGGMSLADADNLRTSLIAARPAELRRLQSDFVALAAVRGHSPSAAASVWSSVARFAAYSFCKAHASSYALLAWQSAWLRERYPLEFGCALLGEVRGGAGGYGGAYPLRTIAADLMRSGIRLLPPDVNRSGRITEIEARTGLPDAIRIGLLRVKHVTAKTADRLIRERRRGPYIGIDELIARVRPSERELRALVLTGACDALAPLSRDGYPFAHEALLQDSADPQSAADRAAAAFDAHSRNLEAYRTLARVRNELELLDLHVTAHPLAVLRQEARRHGCSTSAELHALPPLPSRVRLAGVVAASRRHRSVATRPPTFFLTLEDEEGLIEAVIARSRYRLLAPRVTTPGPYLVDGTVNDDYGHRHLVVSDIRPFHERAAVPAG